MKGLATIYARELAGLFLAPLAWILFTGTWFYNAFFFLRFLEVDSHGQVDDALSLLLGGALPFWFLVLVLPPLLTMRMVSEESRSGMLEFLLTAPVGDGAVIVGKALAATTFLALVWLAGPVYGVACALAGAPPDWGALAVTYLGAVLVAGLFTALGLLWSTLFQTPLVAAFVAVVTNVVVLFLPLAAQSVGGDARQAARRVLSKIDVVANFQGSFQTGVLDTAHLVFFLAWIATLLFVTVRLLERRRWL
ncbi:MAG: ABC transporter permease subunit [Planctomycetota bacterium]